MLRPAVVLCLCLAAGFAQAAPPNDEQRHYTECLTLAKSKPAEGWENASAWQSLGGGDAARHCGAVALIGLGEFEEGAMRLETLAQEKRRAAPIRAGMLAQAASAWSLVGQTQQALRDQTLALSLTPKDTDLLMDRAALYGATGDIHAAIADLDQVVRLAPKRADVYALRASAWRLEGDLGAAERDIVAALKRDPNQPDALLESGVTALARGTKPQARRAWLKLLQVAPESGAADSARQNIEKLDVRGVAN